MNGLDVVEGNGHTLVPEDDLDHLKLSYITTRAELNEAEQQNIAKVFATRRPLLAQLLDDKYLRDLHRRMFGDVWDWAGRYRVAGTNLGLPAEQIPGAVRDLVADAALWFSKVADPSDAVRFYHRLVSVHPFVNGNGRHGRMATEFLTDALGIDRLTWGAGLGLATAPLRRRHIDALLCADEGDIEPLIEFAQS